MLSDDQQNVGFKIATNLEDHHKLNINPNLCFVKESQQQLCFGITFPSEIKWQAMSEETCPCTHKKN